jgi:hypothetical protein
VKRGRPLKLPDHRSVWSEHLRPLGEGSFEKELFKQWWLRHQRTLQHLPADLCEQWIYKHWTHSPFSFLALEDLSCERRSYVGEELLGSIYRAFGGELHPQFDYNTFQRKGGADRDQTALALDAGTWDYPMVLLSTPNDIVELGVYDATVRLVVVEGHQRHRYLNALHVLGMPPRGPHEVLVLTSACLGRS